MIVAAARQRPCPAIGIAHRKIYFFIGLSTPSGPFPPPRSSVGPLHFGDADLVVRVPALLAEPLCHQMPGVLLPGADRGLVDEIRNRDAKPLLTARALRAKAARLLERKFIHRLRHRLVAIVAFA